MKPLSQSRTIRTAAIIVAVGAFFGGIQAAPAGVFPPWVSYLASAAVVALGAYVAALRVSDKKQDDRIKHTAGAFARRDERGASLVEVLTIIGMVILGASILVAMSTACSSTWPSACKFANGKENCRCQTLAAVNHTKSLRYTWECDGVELPVSASYQVLGHSATPAVSP